MHDTYMYDMSTEMKVYLYSSAQVCTSLFPKVFPNIFLLSQVINILKTLLENILWNILLDCEWSYNLYFHFRCHICNNHINIYIYTGLSYLLTRVRGCVRAWLKSRNIIMKSTHYCPALQGALHGVVHVWGSLHRYRFEKNRQQASGAHGSIRVTIGWPQHLLERRYILTTQFVFGVVNFPTFTESRERFVDSALLQGTSHRLIHRFETWKTHDDLNFVKVSDVTQVVDFKGTTKTEKGIAHEKEGSFERCGTLLRVDEVWS